MDGATVFIDSGKTSYWVAQEPGYLRGLPLVSNSLEVVPQGLGRPTTGSSSPVGR